MYSFLCVFVVFMLCTYSSEGDSGELGCKFLKHKNPETNTAVQRLTTLLQKSGLKRVSLDDIGDDGIKLYTYDIGFCVSVGDREGVGVLQTAVDSTSTTVIGRYDDADVMSGSGWIQLTYSGGKNYNSHCGNEPRKAIIMIVCNPYMKHPVARIKEVNNLKTNSCYYLFEVGFQAACADTTLSASTGLSPGSIICIVFLTLAAVYLP